MVGDVLEHAEVLKEEVGKLGEHFSELENSVSAHAETVGTFAARLTRLENNHSTGSADSEEVAGAPAESASALNFFGTEENVSTSGVNEMNREQNN